MPCTYWRAPLPAWKRPHPMPTSLLSLASHWINLPRYRRFHLETLMCLSHWSCLPISMLSGHPRSKCNFRLRWPKFYSTLARANNEAVRIADNLSLASSILAFHQPPPPVVTTLSFPCNRVQQLPKLPPCILHSHSRHHCNQPFLPLCNQ